MPKPTLSEPTQPESTPSESTQSEPALPKLVVSDGGGRGLLQNPQIPLACRRPTPQ